MDGPLSPTALPLITTKLLVPRISQDFVARSNLVRRLDQGLGRKLTLISAPAGYGKSTLLAAWLENSPVPSAWLSLDENDSDLRVFVAYFVAAIRSVFPDACQATDALLSGPELPPAEYLAASLVNEIAGLSGPFILVLDDYHRIAGTQVHHFVSALVLYQPRQLHVVIATRRDPALATGRLRANQQMAEIRLDDLRFVDSEIKEYLEICLGREVSPETVAVLARRTEGWIVGLRLACLALRRREDIPAFLEAFQGTSRYIMDYLMDEVLSGQPRPIQDFMLRTAILDRFCAPLCDDVMEAGDAARLGEHAAPSSVDILMELEKANLFLIPLDQQGEWFRYHQLFQELLRHRLSEELPKQDLTALHAAAGNWLGKNGYVEEALDHYLAVGDVASAAAVVTTRRYTLMNNAQWQQLDHLVGRFPADAVGRIPDLLMLKTWLLYHRGHYAEMPAALQQLDQTLLQVAERSDEVAHLQGEMNALHSLLAYLGVDPHAAIATAQKSISTTPRELWIVRVLARLCLAGALQMTGDLQAAYDTIYGGYAEEQVESDAFKTALLATACNIYWIAADLQGLHQAADQNLELSQHARTAQMRGWAHYHLGCVAYQRNELEEAERHFAAVVQQPYLNYGDCYAHSACGLALTYQAQARPDEANEVADSAVKFMLSTGNTTLLPVVEALQAELALRQGQVAKARQWASRFKIAPPIVPEFRFFAAHLTLVKVWLAQGRSAGSTSASELLARLKTFFETTHNTRFLIEALALQILVEQSRRGQAAALEGLDQALTLAQPGGFIRLFVDLGPNMAPWLTALRLADEQRTHYVDQILAAFPVTSASYPPSDRQQAFATSAVAATTPLAQPLTDRELNVMALLAQGLSDKEIAQRLIISPHTVRTHIKHILGKLEVRNRREAAVRARQLGILPPV